MVNEDKIRLMAKAAAYEKTEGKSAIPISNYFPTDYISINLIWSWVSYTIAFGLIVVLWAFYKVEYLMANIHKMDLVVFGKKLAAFYIIGMILYLTAAGFLYNRKYKKSKKSLSDYSQLLKGISESYEGNVRMGGSKHTAGGSNQNDDFIGI